MTISIPILHWTRSPLTRDRYSAVIEGGFYDLMVVEGGRWQLTFYPNGAARQLLGRHRSKNEGMLAAKDHVGDSE